MVPEGLVLLTSVAFAVGVVRLASKRCLVQELPAIEVLARVDVLCVDKTGTITEGTLALADVEPFDDSDRGDGRRVPAALAQLDPDPNATSRALQNAYTDETSWTVTGRVPFSSARKWSAMTFDDHGSWVLGAPENVLTSTTRATCATTSSSTRTKANACCVLATRRRHVHATGRRDAARRHAGRAGAARGHRAQRRAGDV